MIITSNTDVNIYNKNNGMENSVTEPLHMITNSTQHHYNYIQYAIEQWKYELNHRIIYRLSTITYQKFLTYSLFGLSAG